MSYLIALYVYYHGNNLAVFGITKGARDEDLNNKGMKRPEEIDPNLVSRELIDSAIKEEKKAVETAKAMDWDSMMKDAILKAQQKTFELKKAGVVQNTVFDSTPEAAMNSYEEDGFIPLDFFSSLNGY